MKPQPRPDWRADWVLAWAGALALLLTELLLVAALNRRVVAGVWELQFGLLHLAPAFLLLAFCAGTLALSLGLSLTEPRFRWLPAVVLGVGAFATGFGVGGGRHLASLPMRGGFALALAVIAALFVWWATPRVAQVLLHGPARVALGALVCAVALSLVNRFVLVRLYPAFHLALGGLSLVAASLSTMALRRAFGVQPRAWAPWALGLLAGLVVIGAVLLRPAADRLAHFDNFRLLLTEKAPVGGVVVLGLARLSPPPTLRDDEACLDPSCVPATDGDSPLDWRGRSVLLVTIDALRADHVGAYGYQRATTPHLDALAKGGVLFEYAYAPTPHTSYSVTSLMTGKYMRPLLLQDSGHDSDTWASLLRTYGYRTAAFYPPAIFFIDAPRFEAFSSKFLGFEYRKVEFLEGPPRVAQLEQYLNGESAGRQQFAWVHLFAPHEPYEHHAKHDFGKRDIDRYDSEIAFADETLGALVATFRRDRPDSVVIVTADHGEEFGDHGGRYHGTTVYEEQVRVPLVVSAPGSLRPRRIPEVVQTIDLLPTLLGALDVPRVPRMRGRDLGSVMAGQRAAEAGFALAETEEQALIAEGPHRLICQRRLGACRLFDVVEDPRQLEDRARDDTRRFQALRARLRDLGASHGRFEVQGLRKEGKGWPAAIRRAATGDGESAEELASLLDDADVEVRRKAAELLFELGRPETAAALRLTLGRDEDAVVRRWCALALTRLDQGAPLVMELLRSEDASWRRLAALALAESGDPRGVAVLVDWWKDHAARDYGRSREILRAFAKVRAKDAMWPLTHSLGDVRLRPYLAETLAQIGDEGARISLARAFAEERYQSNRMILARAVVQLGGGPELAPALARFLGVPDPVTGGVGLAYEAGILQAIGGPASGEVKRMQRNAGLGAELLVSVPRGGNGEGVRVIVRARSRRPGAAVVLSPPLSNIKYDRKGEPLKVRDLPRLNPERVLRIPVPQGKEWLEVYAEAPAVLGVRGGRPARLVLFAEREVEVQALALVPLADDLPAPAPKPWRPDDP